MFPHDWWGELTISYDQLETLEDMARAVRAADETGDYATLQYAALALAEAVFPADIQAEQDCAS